MHMLSQLKVSSSTVVHYLSPEIDPKQTLLYKQIHLKVRGYRPIDRQTDWQTDMLHIELLSQIKKNNDKKHTLCVLKKIINVCVDRFVTDEGVGQFPSGCPVRLTRNEFNSWKNHKKICLSEHQSWFAELLTFQTGPSTWLQSIWDQNAFKLAEISRKESFRFIRDKDRYSIIGPWEPSLATVN